MLEEIAGLGFEHVELSHGIRITLVPGILRAVEEGVIKVSSTHNFCPLPTGVVQAAPNLFEPSATDEREHDQWLRHTKRSIDFCAQVKAGVLVCHLGSVKFFWFNPARKVRHYLRDHPEASIDKDPSYRTLLDKSMVKLRTRMGPYWQQTQESLAKVFEHATSKGVILGCENREKFEELPLDADYAGFIQGLPPPTPVAYWHDTGHADIKEGMGLLNHRAHLEANASRLAGFHLHDVNAERDDHQPIGSGHIDFKMISSFWRPHHRLTIELGPRTTVEEVEASKKRIEDLMG